MFCVWLLFVKKPHESQGFNCGALKSAGHRDAVDLTFKQSYVVYKTKLRYVFLDFS